METFSQTGKRGGLHTVFFFARSETFFRSGWKMQFTRKLHVQREPRYRNTAPPQSRRGISPSSMFYPSSLSSGNDAGLILGTRPCSPGRRVLFSKRAVQCRSLVIINARSLPPKSVKGFRRSTRSCPSLRQFPNGGVKVDATGDT